jgi:methyl-accepting chemotaxis protein
MAKYEQINLEDRRPFYNLMVKALVEENPEVVAASTIWESNALDGLDAAFAQTEGADRTGRFIPNWVRTAQGVKMAALRNDAVPQTGNETLNEPYEYELNGQKTLMTTVSMPIKNQGRVVGTVNIDLDMATIQRKVEQIQPYKGTVAVMYSNSGLVGSHFDASRIGKPMTETEGDIAGPYLATLRETIQQGKPFSFTHRTPHLGGELFFISVPIAVGNTTTPWALLLGIPMKAIIAPIYRMLLIGLIISILMLLLISVGSFFVARSISDPLKRMVLILNDIGEGDLTKRLEAGGDDEIRDMTRSFNTTLDKIRGLILMIREKAQSLSQTGTELSASMRATTTAVNEITANIQSMKAQAGNQSAGVAEASRSMEKISAHITHLNDQIDKQAESVAQSTTAIEQMLANIQSVTSTLTRNVDNVRNLAESSGIGRSGLEEVATAIHGIDRESEGLLEITAVIQNIASQTNLLSMNAAIEAAHAGEAGKGFAVVADEIRKLAESSGKQSKTISAVLKRITESIDQITRSTNAVLNKFEAINFGVKTVSEQEEAIRNAMEEQDQGSKQILSAISRLNEITSGVKAGSEEMNVGSKEVIETNRALESITRELTQGMHEMAAGADQINGAVSQVNEMSGRNKSDIDELIQEVNRFKT